MSVAFWERHLISSTRTQRDFQNSTARAVKPLWFGNPSCYSRRSEDTGWPPRLFHLTCYCVVIARSHPHLLNFHLNFSSLLLLSRHLHLPSHQLSTHPLYTRHLSFPLTHPVWHTCMYHSTSFTFQNECRLYYCFYYYYMYIVCAQALSLYFYEHIIL